jgi:hypothetical protein
MQQRDTTKRKLQGMRSCKQNLFQKVESSSPSSSSKFEYQWKFNQLICFAKYMPGASRKTSIKYSSAHVCAFQAARSRRTTTCCARNGASGWAAARLSPLITLGNFIISRLQTIRRRHTAHMYNMYTKSTLGHLGKVLRDCRLAFA